MAGPRACVEHRSYERRFAWYGPFRSCRVTSRLCGHRPGHVRPHTTQLEQVIRRPRQRRQSQGCRTRDKSHGYGADTERHGISRGIRGRQGFITRSVRYSASRSELPAGRSVRGLLRISETMAVRDDSTDLRHVRRVGYVPSGSAVR